MADGRRNKGTSRHPGVSLIPRDNGSVRAKFRDPDSGEIAWETLPSALTTEEQRTAWAIVKARTLRERSALIASGAPTKKHVSLADAVETYFADVSKRLRAKTLRDYRAATGALLSWARDRKIDLADDLLPESLSDLREHVANKPLQRQAKGRGRRSRVTTSQARSEHSINRELRPIKTVLEHLRHRGLVPLLSHDAIRDGLKLAKPPRPIPDPLRPADLVKLVEAARRHDEEVFDLTREEKARGETQGSTLRHPPVLPYLAFVLLTGMRADEARLVRWSAVYLDADPAGEIVLRPQDVKTKQGRRVDLVVSPLLRELLVRMKVKAGRESYVFGAEEPVTRDSLESARKRLVRSYGAPPFSWQRLRVTCGTFLTNAPGIFGAASAYRSAKQLGHSVMVAEKHYAGVVHVSPEAKTLEDAMGAARVLRAALGLGGATETKKKASAEG